MRREFARGTFLRLGPLAMLTDEVHQAVHGFRLGNVEFHRCLADVEVDLARRAADVAEVRIRHFAWAVHDAAHDGNFDTLEMLGAGFDTAGNGLQVEERATARGAGNVIGLKRPATGRLQNVVIVDVRPFVEIEVQLRTFGALPD